MDQTESIRRAHNLLQGPDYPRVVVTGKNSDNARHGPRVSWVFVQSPNRIGHGTSHGVRIIAAEYQGSCILIHWAAPIMVVQEGCGEENWDVGVVHDAS